MGHDALIEVFAEVLQVDPAELNDDSSPDNVKRWDSLAAMALVACSSSSNSGSRRMNRL